MASRIHYYEEALGRTTSTTTNYSTVKITLPFTPTNGKTYAIIWSVLLDGDAQYYSHKVRIQNTTDATTLSDQGAWVRNATVATSNFSAGGIALYTAASASQQTIEMQVASSTALLTLGASEARLLILELIDGVDIWASSAGQSNLSSTTFTTKVSNSWTPGSAGNYLTLATGELLPGGSNGEEKVQLNINNGTVAGLAGNVDYDTGVTWYPYTAAYRHIGITAPTTAWLQYGGVTTTQVSIRNAYIVSLRLDQFDSSFWAEQRTPATTTSATYTDRASVSGSSVARDYAVIACGNCDLTTGTQYVTASANRIAVDTAAQGTTFSHSRLPGPGYYWHWFQVLKRTEAAASTTWTTQHSRSVGAGTARVDEHVIAVLQLNAIESVGITTAAKRASVQAYSGDASALVGYLGTVAGLDAGDRAHITGSYRALPYGPQQAIFTPATAYVVVDGLEPALTSTLVPTSAAVVLTGQQVGLARLLTPTVAAVTASGNAPSRSLTIALQPTAAAVSVSGLAPTLSVSINLQAVAGAVSATGLQPGRTVGLAPPSAQVALTGLSAALTKMLAPSLGAITASGLAPTLGGTTSLQPATGAMTATGLAPVLTRTLTASLAPVAVSGLQAAILKGLSPSLGVVTAAGIAPTLSVTRYLDSPLGAVAVAGFAPSISVTRYLAASTGAVVATGNQPSLGSTVPLEPTTGAVAASGVAPALYRTLVPSLAAITAAGQTAQLSLSIRGVLGPVAVAGNAPTLTVLQLIALAPTTGAAMAAGLAPSMGLSLTASAGVIVATGNQPTLGGTVAIAPTTAVVSATGIAPSKTLTLAGVAGSISVAGNTPSLNLLQLIALQAQTGAIALAGIAPARALSLVPSLGTAIVTGNAPTLGGTTALAPTTGVISAIGLAASKALALLPSTGAIAASGNAASVLRTNAVVGVADAAVLKTLQSAVSADLNVAVGSTLAVTADAVVALSHTVELGAGAVVNDIQRVIPDALSVQTNLTGTVGDIDEDPDSSDANWLTATSAVAPIDLLVAFDNSPGVPDGPQNFRTQLRKTAGAPDPTVDISLYQGGSPILTLVNDQAITNATSQIVQADWLSSDLVGVLDGSDVECRITGTVGSTLTTGALPVGNATAGTLFSNVTITATRNISVPAHAAGDLLLLVVLIRNTNHDQNFNSINTAGWTQAGGAGNEYGILGTSDAIIGFGWAIGNGSDTLVNITTTGGTGTARLIARVYRFTAANGFASPPVQNIGTPTTGTGTSLSMPTATRVTANDLAVTVYASSTAGTVAAASGEAGGNWTEALAESSSTNGIIGYQRSSYTGTTVSGGTATLSVSGSWVAVPITIVPADVATAVNTLEVGAVEWNGIFDFPSITSAILADAAVQAQVTAQTSLDVAAAIQSSVSAAMDGAVAVETAIVVSADAAVALSSTIETTADCVVSILNATSTLADAAVLKTLSSVTGHDLLIQTDGIIVIASAAVQATRVASVTADVAAAIQRTQSVDADLVILKTLTASALADAAVRVDNFAISTSANAGVAVGRSVSTTLDAVVSLVASSQIVADAAVLAEKSVAVTADVVVGLGHSIETSADAALLAELDVALVADAGVALTDSAISIVADVLVFNYNPFLTPSATNIIRKRAEGRTVTTTPISRIVTSPARPSLPPSSP